MNENINLCEILKGCPKGTKFFSYMHGEVKFHSIDKSQSHPINVEAKTKSGYNRIKTFSIGGRFDEAFNGICTLVPSLEQPDWSKWQCPKPKFDPKTLKVFKEVLVRDGNGTWEIDIFGYIDEDGWAICLKHGYTQCVPINDETKNLFDTRDEAPEYYRYWED